MSVLHFDLCDEAADVANRLADQADASGYAVVVAISKTVNKHSYFYVAARGPCLERRGLVEEAAEIIRQQKWGDDRREKA